MNQRDRRGHDRMEVGFTTTYAISAYHHWCCELDSHSWRGVLDTTLCDKVCRWLLTGRWFSPSPPVSSTNKTDRHDVTEILLKVSLNTIKQTLCGLNFYSSLQCISYRLNLYKATTCLMWPYFTVPLEGHIRHVWLHMYIRIHLKILY